MYIFTKPLNQYMENIKYHQTKEDYQKILLSLTFMMNKIKISKERMIDEYLSDVGWTDSEQWKDGNY